MASPCTQGRRAGKDAIEQLYTAVSGGCSFAPPQPEGNGYAGDFLFGK